MGTYTLVRAGSSLKFCLVAEGSADVYPRLDRTREWDTAAARAVVLGAGGVIRQLNGMDILYGKEDIYNPYFVVSAQPFKHD